MIILDTTYLIDVLNNHVNIEKAKALREKFVLYTTEINVFELLVGVYSRPLEQQTKLEERAKNLIDKLIILEGSRKSTIKAAKILGELVQKGQMIEPTDCLVAGIALENGIKTIITRNVDHFKRIKELKVETY